MPNSNSQNITISPGDVGFFIGARSGYGTSFSTIIPEEVTSGYTSRIITITPAYGFHGYTQLSANWQTITTGSPPTSQVTFQLQGAIDNTNTTVWTTIDTSTNIAGEVRYIALAQLQNFKNFRIHVSAGSSSAIVKFKSL